MDQLGEIESRRIGRTIGALITPLLLRCNFACGRCGEEVRDIVVVIQMEVCFENVIGLDGVELLKKKHRGASQQQG